MKDLSFYEKENSIIILSDQKKESVNPLKFEICEPLAIKRRQEIQDREFYAVINLYPNLSNSLKKRIKAFSIGSEKKSLLQNICY